MATLACHLTTHAVKRYQERVRPGLGWEGAERELIAVLALADETTVAPQWLAERQARQAARYLVLGDLVWPLAQSSLTPDTWIVMTCLTRGGISDPARQARNRRRRQHQSVRAIHRDLSARRARAERGGSRRS